MLPKDLLRVLAHLRDPEAIQNLVNDLLTPAELKSVGERWSIVNHLAAGRTQREVRDELGVAIATVSRGAHQLRSGHGGFDLAFSAMHELGLEDPRSQGGNSP